MLTVIRGEEVTERFTTNIIGKLRNMDWFYPQLAQCPTPSNSQPNVRNLLSEEGCVKHSFLPAPQIPSDWHQGDNSAPTEKFVDMGTVGLPTEPSMSNMRRPSTSSLEDGAVLCGRPLVEAIVGDSSSAEDTSLLSFSERRAFFQDKNEAGRAPSSGGAQECSETFLDQVQGLRSVSLRSIC